jgi:hypothetical protein
MRPAAAGTPPKQRTFRIADTLQPPLGLKRVKRADHQADVSSCLVARQPPRGDPLEAVHRVWVFAQVVEDLLPDAGFVFRTRRVAIAHTVSRGNGDARQ